MPTCPSCAHSWTRAKKANGHPSTAAVNTANLSTADVYAHYNRTAPVDDVRFWLAHADLAPDLRAQFEELLTMRDGELVPVYTNRTEHYHQLTRLQDAWRRNGRQVPDERAFWAYQRSIPAPVIRSSTNWH